MPHDPFQKREAQKYENPIPSRECILTNIKQRTKPTRREELAQDLGISGEEKTEALRRRLRAMERDGQLMFTPRSGYAIPKRSHLLITGKVIGHRDGFGFLRVLGRKDDLYLSSEQMKMCLHGDVILAQAMGVDRKGRCEACVVRIIEPRNSHIVGRCLNNTTGNFVIPSDNRLNFHILIQEKRKIGTDIGSVVVVQLIERPTRRNPAIGKIVEILGRKMDTNMAINIALRAHYLPHQWSSEIKKVIEKINTIIPIEDKHGRVDLRKLPLVTIDGEDSSDFDDAVFCEPQKEGGWRLWVAIADVSYYVRPGTLLDREAINRGTSVYFPSQVVPMLPEILSNNLCSLNPEVDRLCIVCEMIISSHGKLISYKHYEAIMNSFAQLTYNTVWKILQGDQQLRKKYKPIINNLETLHNLYLKLDQSREQRGGISFEMEEAKFIFNINHRIERVEKIVRNDAHKLIEECMILANIASALFVEKYNEPALFRDHDRPIDDSIKSFRSILNELGLTLLGGEKPEPLDYADLLKKISGRPDHEMIQSLLLRSMKQAVYDSENRGHFGLALASYAHFTSPIRRYPDLLLHRAIKYLLAKNMGNLKNQCTPTGGFHYTIPQMLQFGQHCSMTERRADEATRDVIDWLKCDFIKDRVGEAFSGVISTVTNFGFFVRLSNLFIDGLVHISTLNNDRYRFDSVGQRLIGAYSNIIYRLGDQVEVRIDSVHLEERKINLTLIYNQKTPSLIDSKSTKPKSRKIIKTKKRCRRPLFIKEIHVKKITKALD
ncbi:Ribonuclease R [Candidatus Erwinia haradaeae]|uniref:Ribonuclease R n=1 Tax=Candidatus Erwinia haradaeae TaxID=1922217 RepID=A0A803FSZ0_9GAMM|nr:ribonuclease R [Candidatus Erwinia haradaeae]VFP87351.1 Ribonuclease R [Candidatus Erwinia haradaeae]